MGDRIAIATEILFKMDNAIEQGDKELFTNLLVSNKGKLHNCTCGDSYLQQFAQKIYAKALEKFL